MNRTMAVKGYGVFSGFLLAGVFTLALTGCDLLKDNPVSDKGETLALNENVDVDKPAGVPEETPAEAEIEEVSQEKTPEEAIQEHISEQAGQIDLKDLDIDAIPVNLDNVLLQNLAQTLSIADPQWLAGSCLYLRFAKTEVNEDQVKLIDELEIKFCPDGNTPALPLVIPPQPPPPCPKPGQCDAPSLPPKPIDPAASQREACGNLLQSWLKTLPKQEQFYTKPAFYICLGGGREEAMCKMIKKELPGRPSAFGKMVFEQHCREKPQPAEPPGDPCEFIFEKHMSPENSHYVKLHYTICMKPDVVPQICESMFRELDQNPTPYGKDLAGKYCADATPPPPLVSEDPDRAREEYCHEEFQNWQRTLSQDDIGPYIKPAYMLCLGKDIESMCAGIEKTLQTVPTMFGRMIYAKNCEENVEPVEPPKDPCEFIFEKHMSPENSHYVKLHYTICMKPDVLPQICESMFRELDRNPTPYGKDLAGKYCAAVPPPPPPSEPQRPSPATKDSCNKLLDDWMNSLRKNSTIHQNDGRYLKPAHILCLGMDNNICDRLERQLEKIPSEFGQTIYQENCVEDNSAPADTTEGCMAAARLHSVYYHLGLRLNYGLFKDAAYRKCGQMMYPLAEPKPLCVDLENALPTVPADSKEYETIGDAMESACK